MTRRRFSKSLAALAICLTWLAGATLAPAAGEEYLDLFADAEQSRGDLGRQGIVWVVTVVSLENGEEKTLRMRVIHQSSKVLAEVLEPEKSRGTKYLVTDGKMWFHKPALSRPISISRRQRVMGNAAIGDVAAISYLEDYSVEAVEDGEHQGDSCHVFSLKQKSKSASYPAIRYWVSKTRRVGVKAEFFSVSGTKLRTAIMEYEHKVNIDGKNRDFISRMTVEEQLGATKSTTLHFGDFELKQFPPGIFEQESLAPERAARPGGPKKPF